MSVKPLNEDTKCNICIDTCYDIEKQNGKKCTICNEGFICDNKDCNKVNYTNCLICKNPFCNNNVEQNIIDRLSRIERQVFYINHSRINISTEDIEYRDCLERVLRRYISNKIRNNINGFKKCILYIIYSIITGLVIIEVPAMFIAPFPENTELYDVMFMTFIIGWLTFSSIFITCGICCKSNPCNNIMFTMGDLKVFNII